MTFAALAAAALLASAPPADARGTALERVTRDVAARVAAGAKPADTRLLAFVSAPDSPELLRAAQTALLAELERAGFRGVRLVKSASADAAEAEARASGSDVLVRLTVRVDGPDLTATGDVIPTWVNFWSGRDVVRTGPGRVLAAKAPVDAEALALAHVLVTPEGNVPATKLPATTGEAKFTTRPFTRVAERVLAVALGDLDGDGATEVAALTPSAVLVFRKDGALITRHDFSGLARSPHPPREPAGALAVGAFGTDGKVRLGYFASTKLKGEVLALEAGELRPVGTLDLAPLCTGQAGTLSAAPVPGRNTFTAELRAVPSGKTASLPFTPVALAGSARGREAYVAVGSDGAGRLLNAELAPVEEQLPVLGAGTALADLDGDGSTELVTSLLTRGEDAVKIYRLDAGHGPSELYSAEAPGPVMAGASGDLDGDGHEDAVLAAWTGEGSVLLVAGVAR